MSPLAQRWLAAAQAWWLAEWNADFKAAPKMLRECQRLSSLVPSEESAETYQAYHEWMYAQVPLRRVDLPPGG
jgi:hypothetical protein